MYKQAGLWCGSPFESLSDGQWCVGRFPTQSNPYNLSLSLRPQERFVIQVTDLLTVSMMLGITAQVKEAGLAWDKGEKKSE